MRRPGRSGWFAGAGLAVGLALAGRAHGDDPGAALVAAGGDPLELGRVVAALGDAAVLAALEEKSPTSERLAAIRAARWLAAPEQALGPLTGILEGRDSELAPAAARAVAQIAAALDSDALARREVLPETLSEVRKKLEAAAARETLRPDIRLLAGEAAAQLAGAGVR